MSALCAVLYPNWWLTTVVVIPAFWNAPLVAQSFRFRSRARSRSRQLRRPTGTIPGHFERRCVPAASCVPC
ncbi:hypothetical protein F5Y01DRAFT_286440 [Xylaria sp. FL0043]|nr:hypothetical protein F5Y01DRAFT_286440 [Xylaria sp. FL0043]